MTKVLVSHETYLISEKIFIGALKPLQSFMGEAEFLSVCSNKHLLDGSFFPIPYSLPVDKDVFGQAEIGHSIPLIYQNETVGEIHVSDKFYANPKVYAKEIFLTDQAEHPGVFNYLQQSGYFLGGRIVINTKQPFYLSSGELGPENIKNICQRNAGEAIVGFATRNVPHEGHVHIIRKALEWADKVLVLASIGSSLPGAYSPQAIVESFTFIKNKYDMGDRLIFDFISMPPTLSGPSEAMIQALIRRNYGASYFIIGRNHSGIGEFYETYQAQETALLYQKEMNINIVKQKGPYFCTLCDNIVTEDTCDHSSNSGVKVNISSSDLIKAQREGMIGDSRIFDCELWRHLKQSGIKIFLE